MIYFFSDSEMSLSECLRLLDVCHPYIRVMKGAQNKAQILLLVYFFVSNRATKCLELCNEIVVQYAGGLQIDG